MDSKVECDQLNLAHIARKNIKKKKLKQTNASAHYGLVQVQDLWMQSRRNQEDYGWKDLWKRWVISLEWKAKGVIDGESKGVLHYFGTRVLGTYLITVVNYYTMHECSIYLQPSTVMTERIIWEERKTWQISVYTRLYPDGADRMRFHKLLIYPPTARLQNDTVCVRLD